MHDSPSRPGALPRFLRRRTFPWNRFEHAGLVARERELSADALPADDVAVRRAAEVDFRVPAAEAEEKHEPPTTVVAHVGRHAFGKGRAQRALEPQVVDQLPVEVRVEPRVVAAGDVVRATL